MKVYVVSCDYYEDCDRDFSVLSVSYSRETAIEKIEEFTKDYTEDNEYVFDEQSDLMQLKTGESNVVRLFYQTQENWDYYYTYFINEIDIDF